MRYLIIMEDGTMVQSDGITDGDIQAVDDGYADIVDTSTMTQYHMNDWHEIDIYIPEGE